MKARRGEGGVAGAQRLQQRRIRAAQLALCLGREELLDATSDRRSHVRDAPRTDDRSAPRPAGATGGGARDGEQTSETMSVR